MHLDFELLPPSVFLSNSLEIINNSSGCKFFYWPCIWFSWICFSLQRFVSFGSSSWSLSCTICAYKITVSWVSFFCIIYMTHCLLTWRTCIIKKIKIPTTILIMWERPIQINFNSEHTWISCTSVMPIWKETRLPRNAFVRNQNISKKLYTRILWAKYWMTISEL